jgi:hypothetical protein
VKLATDLQLMPRSRECGFIHPLLHKPSWSSAKLVKHRDNFNLETIGDQDENYAYGRTGPVQTRALLNKKSDNIYTSSCKFYEKCDIYKARTNANEVLSNIR